MYRGLLIVLAPAIAAAQPLGAARSLRVTFDNDLIAVRGAGAPPDYDYTHGMQVAVARDGGPRWLQRLSGRRKGCRVEADRRGGCLVTVVMLGQEIYTPRRDAEAPIPGERPYGGWLYASAAARLVSPGRARTMQATLGVTGTPSLAEEVQGGVHRLLDNTPQLGWANQIATAPGIQLAYSDVRRGERRVGGRGVAALRGHWGATLGTTRRALSVGAGGSIGLRGAEPRREPPWSPAQPEVERPARAYLLFDYRQDWVLHDVFVAGRGDGAGAARRPLVGQLELGIGYRWRAFGLEYGFVSRGREYRAQPGAHTVGSVRATFQRF